MCSICCDALRYDRYVAIRVNTLDMLRYMYVAICVNVVICSICCEMLRCVRYVAICAIRATLCDIFDYMSRQSAICAICVKHYDMCDRLR